MSNAAATILFNMVLTYLANTNTPDINTPDLVDQHGFRAYPLRRMQQIAMDQMGATKTQAQHAAMMWVKAGSPSMPEGGVMLRTVEA